jgi:hypothetical protein
MTMPERDLLVSSCGVEKEGVLFIGRWEGRKNPKEFVRVIKETGLLAKVMTNKKGAVKFKKALDEIGARYIIKESIVGSEKVEFIKSSKVFFMPSRSESYGFALMEAIGHCHSVVLEEYSWWSNFDQSHLNETPKKNAATVIGELHGTTVTPRGLEYVKSLDSSCDQSWQRCFEQFKARQSPTTSATIVHEDNLYYSDFVRSLKRFASAEDVIAVLANRHRFNVLQDKESTYLTKTGTEMPTKEKARLDDFF